MPSSKLTPCAEKKAEPPLVLAAANIHPDHLDACIEHCCTGTRHQCRLTPGTITLIRRTTGGQGGKSYGVAGLWYFTGENEPVGRGEILWPPRWGIKVKFRPLVCRFEMIWCEDFCVSSDELVAVHKSSKYVPGLVYTKLQGNIVTIKEDVMAANYLQAIINAKQQELRISADYQGEKVIVLDLLEELVQRFRANAHTKRPPHSQPLKKL